MNFRLVISLLVLLSLISAVNAIAQYNSTDGAYTVIKFNGTGDTTWTVPAGVSTIEYLVVAGGGSGGGAQSSEGCGGGGAGGMLNGTGFSVAGTLNITVGSGGADPGYGGYTGKNGTNSSLGNLSVNYTAVGGGGGASFITAYPNNGIKGGSGGGGAGGYDEGAGGANVSGQGYPGGYGLYNYGGGGGGGAGAKGTNASIGDAPPGGSGRTNNITGCLTYYAGGGGGSIDYSSNQGGAGGAGGGGQGGGYTTYATNGTNGYGGGGGGGGGISSTKAGYGGSGVVILRYLTPVAPTSRFQTNVSSGAVPFAVYFADYSNNTPNFWNWSFGDGTSSNSTTQNVTHTYTVPGIYNVTLNASNDAGGTSSTWYRCIIVGEIPKTNTNPKKLYLPMNGSNGSSTIYDYSNANNSVFMTGSAKISTLQSKFGGSSLYINNSTGLVWVVDNESLELLGNNFYIGWWENSTTRPAGSTLMTNYRTSMPGGAWYSWFAAYSNFPQLQTYAGNTSAGWDILNGQSTGIVTCKTWNYYAVTRNGTSFSTWKDGVLQNETIASGTIYGTRSAITIGGYHYIWNSGEDDPIYPFNGFIDDLVIYNGKTINGSIVPTREFLTNPNANFTRSNSSGNVPLLVNFTDTSDGNTMTEWNWSFGDGTYSNAQNPNHVYSSSGTFNITLNATNPFGSNSTTKSVTVTGTVPIVGVRFNNSGFEMGNLTYWDSDGFQSSVVGTENHTGIYAAELTGSGGYIDQYVNLTDSRNVTFWAKAASGTFSVWVGGTENIFTAYPTWTQYSIDTYMFTGNNDIFVADDWGGIPLYLDDFNVTMSTPEPISNWTPVRTLYGISPATITFTDQSTHSPTSWNWSFGDGSYSTSQNPTHTYTSTGAFIVTLNATNAQGTGTRARQIVNISTTGKFYESYTVNGSRIGLVTSDNGVDWFIVDPSNSYLPGTGTSVTPQYKSIIYIGNQTILADNSSYNSDAGFYEISIVRSTDMGRTWNNELDSLISDVSQPHFTFSNLGNGLIAAGIGTDANLYTSPNFGENWELCQTFGNYGAETDGSIQAIIPMGMNKTAIFVRNSTIGMALDEYISTDNFKTYPTLINVLPSEWSGSTISDTSYLGVNSSSGNDTLLVSYDFGKVFKSTDGGLTWVNTSDNDFKNGTGIGYFANIGNGRVIGAVYSVDIAHQYVYTSLDYGNNWTLTSDDIPNFEWVKSLTYIGNGKLLMGTQSVPGTIYLSLDNGSTWTSINPESPVDIQDYTGLINFTMNVTSGNTPVAVLFNDTSTSIPTVWNWSFGDGNYSNDKNTTHVYEVIGIHNVSLTVWDSNGMFMKTQDMTVLAAGVPVADFTMSNSTGPVPLLVNFTDTSTNTPTAWNWSFGDGNYSDARYPNHTYTGVGNFTVILNASNALGWGNVTKYVNTTAGDIWSPWGGCYKYVNGSYTIIKCNNTSTTLNWTAPVDVAYIDIIVVGGGGAGMGGGWGYGGGGGGAGGIVYQLDRQVVPGTDYSITVGAGATYDTHINGLNSTFDVITAYGGGSGGDTNALGNGSDGGSGGGGGTTSLQLFHGGCSTQAGYYAWGGVGYGNSGGYNFAGPVYDGGGGGGAGSVGGSASATQAGAGGAGLPFNLTGCMTYYGGGGAGGYSGYMGGGAGNSGGIGGGGDSNGGNGLPESGGGGGGYWGAGHTGGNGGSGIVMFRYLTPSTSAPVADFTMSNTTGSAPLLVQFNDTSTNVPSSWNWSVNNGTVTYFITKNPTQIFTSVGNYTVILNVSNSYGWDNVTKYFNIGSSPLTVFNMTPNPAPITTSVVFVDMSANSPISWNWSFGDGSYSESQNTTHTYPTIGTFNVTLNTSNGLGYSSSSQNLTIIPATPVANLSVDHNVGANPLLTNFTDISTGYCITAWYWQFGDGNTSVLQNPSHEYVGLGTYNVNLTVYSSVGDNKSQNVPIYVVASPVPYVDFVGAPLSGTAPLSVQFTDMSAALGGVTGWNWSFGDGNYSNSQNPVYIYQSTGIYSVTLVATSGPFSNFTSKISYVNVGLTSTPIVANFVATPTYCATYPVTVQFTDTSVCSPACTNWAWDFNNDGSVDSLAQNPSYVYTYPGNYSPKLIVSNGINTGTKIRNLYITVGPVFVAPTIPQPTGTWHPGYQGNNGTQFMFKGDSSIDLPNSTFLKYWLQNFSATGNFSVYGFATGLMAPIMHVFGFWIFLIIWGLYLFAVWIRSQDVTLPLIIGILSIGTFGLLFPKESLPVIIIMFVICGAIIITKLMKDSI